MASKCSVKQGSRIQRAVEQASKKTLRYMLTADGKSFKRDIGKRKIAKQRFSLNSRTQAD